MIDYSQHVTAGKILKTHGLHGWCKVSVFLHDWNEYYKKLIDLNSNFVEIIETKVFDEKKKIFLIKVKNINNIDEAYKIVNKYLFLNKKYLKFLEENKYYNFELQGRNVVNNKKKNIGYVLDILNYGTQDIIKISLNIGKTVCLPFESSIFNAVANDNTLIITEKGEDLIIFLK